MKICEVLAEALWRIRSGVLQKPVTTRATHQWTPANVTAKSVGGTAAGDYLKSVKCRFESDWGHHRW